jgi:S-formylglutathione hydrolase FrmB
MVGVERITNARHGQETQMDTTVHDLAVAALTAENRCDRCSARAVVVTVMFGGSSLLWCGHHYDKYEQALAANGATVLIDERIRNR